MHRTLRLLAALLSITLVSHAEELRVLTFNIRYDNTEDGLDAWKYRKEAVAKAIAQHDLAGLQEVKPGQRDWLRANLPEFEIVGIGREKDDSDESAPIVFRKDRLELEKSGTFWLSETPEAVASKSWDSSLPRICTWAVLKDRRDGKRLAIFNVHLDHRGAEARDRGIALVLERMKSAGTPTLLTGDFNCTEKDAPIRRVRAHEKPAFARSTDATGVADEGTFHGFKGKAAGAAAIDFIFGEKSRIRVKSHAVLKPTYPGADGVERHASDHFAVGAVVESVVP